MGYDCPQEIKQRVEQAALNSGGSVARLCAAAESVSSRYRREGGQGGGPRQGPGQGSGMEDLQIRSRDEALAYLVARMPATYAANARVWSEILKVYPAISPQSILDIGAGPGTATLAALTACPSIKKVTLVEPNLHLSAVGRDLVLAGAGDDNRFHWLATDINRYVYSESDSYDVILMSYVLNEIAPDNVHKLVEKIWSTCSKTIIIIEPGTPRGAEIIGKIRQAALGWAHTAILAPCPHHGVCPLQDGNKNGRWCHFSVRTSRSKLHKSLKGGEAGFEDEKFSYIVLSRPEMEKTEKRTEFRVIGHPSGTKIREVQVCGPDGVGTLRLSKSDPLYKASRKWDWGDGF